MNSYISGSATAFGENGEDLVRDSDRGMVVVLIQYRLGLFGKSQLHYILNLLLTSDRRIPCRFRGKEKRSIKCWPA
jgi:carboxylesterase type B